MSKTRLGRIESIAAYGKAICMSRSRLWRLLLGIWLLVGSGQLALAQDTAAPFYKGKTITIVVGSSPGGGYDLYGRMLARHIGKHIPGNPGVIVNNMPGAASNVAAAYIYNVAPKDGTVIGALFMGAVVDPLFGNRPRPTHDMSKFNYIGNANKDVYVCLIRADAPVKNFAEALEKRAHYRRHRRRRIDAGFPGTPEEPPWREVQDRLRLSRIDTGQSRDGAWRGAGRLRSELVERLGDSRRLVQGRHHQGAGAGGRRGLSGP
jgi:hypothetical protein